MSFFKSSNLWKDSALLGLAIIGIAASVMGIAGISFADFWATWHGRLGVTVVIYIAIVILVMVAKLIIAKTGVTVNVNGITIHIKQGDLFGADGLKVIPFNEYFDTTVDDKVISHSSLNGLFIDNHVDDIDELRRTIGQDDESKTNAKRTEGNGRFVYPLGRVITYQNYLLLASTHFNDQNMAHVSKIQYEQCLMTMWHEISRTYAGRPVILPLLGSGITRFDDVPNKSHFDLLKCMLCTLKSSGENINAPITILLTADIMQKLNIYEAKGAI